MILSNILIYAAFLALPGIVLVRFSSKPEQRVSNAAVLLGLLYVILEGPYVDILPPYVDILPPLPFFTLFASLLVIGIYTWKLDRGGVPNPIDVAEIGLLRGVFNLIPGIELRGSGTVRWFRIERRLHIENDWRIRDLFSLGLLFSLPTLYWRYSTKFLGMSTEYLSKMATDITCKTGVGCVVGAQQNLAYYPVDKMVIFFGGFTLLFFLLVQNEFSQLTQWIQKGFRFLREAFRNLFKSVNVDDESTGNETRDRIDPVTEVKVEGVHGTVTSDGLGFYGVSTTLFAISVFILCYVLVPILDLTPSSQIPLLFLGAGVASGILLLQNNLNDLMSIRRDNIHRFVDGSPRSISTGVSLLTIVATVVLVLNVSMIPLIARDIPAFLTLITLIVLTIWSFILSEEGSKPSVQSHRTAAFVFLLMFPFMMYLFMRVFFLQNDGTNPVMLNRWSVAFEFMDETNKFKINPWPLDAEPNIDSKWIFLKAAIINSVRVTFVSIILCTILGIIVGVARLSGNKLTSWAATAYVEIFRNLPLAVLLFLLATQIGLQFPMMPEEKNLLGGAIYYSNKGIWFTTVASYGALAISIFGLALLRALFRHNDRTEPRVVSAPSGFSLRRPFASLGWRLEPLAADLFVVISLVLLVIRAQIGDALFQTPNGYWSPQALHVGSIGGVIISESMLEALFSPFLGALPDGTNVQSLGKNARIAIGPLLCVALVVYSLLVTTNVDDDGMNALEIDDSEEGIRRRFTLWTVAFAFALGLTLAGGIYEVGEALSMPQYTKDVNGDGILDQPGSWGIEDGTGFEITPFFLAMVMGLTLFTASVVAEIVRGSIQSLPRGQVEAAISLSLNPYQRLRLVILPQALRSMIPLMNNQFMNVWKNSSLAIVVAYTDIFYVILVMMNNVGKLIPLFLLLLVTYQIGSLIISTIMNWYNSRITSVKI
jgi:His/Glu/Gln/Arg/opine family amino acid ABC transporter permease subunit